MKVHKMGLTNIWKHVSKNQTFFQHAMNFNHETALILVNK